MKNAHERFGTLEYTKRMKDTTTHIRLRLDRFIGEIDGERNSKIHVISVLGGDSDVAAIGAAINEQSLFTVQGPGIEPVSATLGEGAQCFRGTISIAGRKPIRLDVGRAGRKDFGEVEQALARSGAFTHPEPPCTSAASA